MKTFGKLLLFGVLLLITIIVSCVRGDYKTSKEFSSYWELTKLSSTIDGKIIQMNSLIDGIEKTELQGDYDAIWLKTPENSFDSNFAVIKKYNQRLKEMQCMSVTSFEYQTAMIQINTFESDRLDYAIGKIVGIWHKNYLWIIWDWIGLISTIIAIVFTIAGIIIWNENAY